MEAILFGRAPAEGPRCDQHDVFLVTDIALVSRSKVMGSTLMSTIKPAQPPTQDRAHDVLRTEGHPLDAIFNPQRVAVIGASERPGSIGRAVLWSLVSSPFGGTVFPISDKRTSVLGIKAYRTIADVPEPVDLAVVVT